MMFYICKPHWVFCEPLGLSKTCCVCLLGFGMILTPAGQTERKLHISNVSAVCFLWLNWTSSCSLVFSFMEMLHYYHLLPPHPLYITAVCVCPVFTPWHTPLRLVSCSCCRWSSRWKLNVWRFLLLQRLFDPVCTMRWRQLTAPSMTMM